MKERIFYCSKCRRDGAIGIFHKVVIVTEKEGRGEQVFDRMGFHERHATIHEMDSMPDMPLADKNAEIYRELLPERMK